MHCTGSKLFTALLMLLLTGCASMPPGAVSPRVNLVGLQIVDVQLFEQRYALSIRIQNPNPQALSVAGLDFNVALNGKAFADGVSNQQVAIPAFGDSLLTVEVSSSVFRLVDQFRALERNNGQGLRYRISGSVSLQGSWTRLPFERQGVIGESLTPRAKTL
jgi:LEA14-like dessication related protein